MRESGSLEKRCTAPRRTRSLGFQGLRSQPEGMRKTGSLEKKCTAPRRTRSLGSRAAVRAGRNEENWFPRKKAVHPGEPDLLAPLAQVSPGRNEEKWFPRERVRRLSGGPNLLVSWTRV